MRRRQAAALVAAAGLAALWPAGCARSVPGDARPARALVVARLDGILARLDDFAPAREGRWRSRLEAASAPRLAIAGRNHLVLSEGLARLAQDEAAMAGLLAVGMVRARLEETRPDLTEQVEAALDDVAHRRRVIARLAGYAGAETGNAARSALSIVAAAGYDPAALAELAEGALTGPAGAAVLGGRLGAEDLTQALPAVSREFASARARNRAAWRKVRDGLDRD